MRILYFLALLPIFALVSCEMQADRGAPLYGANSAVTPEMTQPHSYTVVKVREDESAYLVKDYIANASDCSEYNGTGAPGTSQNGTGAGATDAGIIPDGKYSRIHFEGYLENLEGYFECLSTNFQLPGCLDYRHRDPYTDVIKFNTGNHCKGSGYNEAIRIVVYPSEAMSVTVEGYIGTLFFLLIYDHPPDNPLYEESITYNLTSLVTMMPGVISLPAAYCEPNTDYYLAMYGITLERLMDYQDPNDTTADYRCYSLPGVPYIVEFIGMD